MENNNDIKNFRNAPTFRSVANQAQKFSEIAYLEATKPEWLQNQEVISFAYKEAKRLTNRLVNAGYWKKSVILGG